MSQQRPAKSSLVPLGEEFTPHDLTLLLLDHTGASGRAGEKYTIVHNPLSVGRFALTEKYHFANFTFTFITSSFHIERKGQCWLFKKAEK